MIYINHYLFTQYFFQFPNIVISAQNNKDSSLLCIHTDTFTPPRGCMSSVFCVCRCLICVSVIGRCSSRRRRLRLRRLRRRLRWRETSQARVRWEASPLLSVSLTNAHLYMYRSRVHPVSLSAVMGIMCELFYFFTLVILMFVIYLYIFCILELIDL